jgi:hypothetical protein
MTMAESASLSQACVRAARISAEAPLTTRIAVICCHSCQQRQNPNRYTVRTEFLRLTGLLNYYYRKAA